MTSFKRGQKGLWNLPPVSHYLHHFFIIHSKLASPLITTYCHFYRYLPLHQCLETPVCLILRASQILIPAWNQKIQFTPMDVNVRQTVYSCISMLTSIPVIMLGFLFPAIHVSPCMLSDFSTDQPNQSTLQREQRW
jgi:hypothetical protein